MKSILSRLLLVAGLLVLSILVQAQVEIKGSGSTGATSTLDTKNGLNVNTMTVRDNGNVGIGTTTPATRLDVNGMITAGGGVIFPSGGLQTIAYTGASGPPGFTNTFYVSSAGGHFPTIGAAIAACIAPSATNQYLINIMPGVYTENVFCQKFVSLKGAGKYAATINGFIVAADSMVIEGLHIRQGIQCPSVSPTIILNLITNQMMGGNGIDIFAPGKPWIKENEINDCMGWGIMCTGFFADPWIIANKIMRNQLGGIHLQDCSPTISNNFIDSNHVYGIYMQGAIGTPTEPTISDNVIGHTDYMMGGRGIYMTGYAEPRIISNDIYLNECGIWIDPNTQPSIIGNNINYNYEAGIRCYSNGASKRVVIHANHIHSNCHAGGAQPAGIWVTESNVMITNNNITQNSVPAGAGLPDIDYSTCFGSFPVKNSNTYDVIIRSGVPGAARGMYNSTSNGAAIAP